MNERILEIFISTGHLLISGEDLQIAKKFFQYLDKNSLFLRFLEKNESGEYVFFVSDDSIRYSFSLTQVKDFWAELKAGKSIDWENLPFVWVSSPSEGEILR